MKQTRKTKIVLDSKIVISATSDYPPWKNVIVANTFKKLKEIFFSKNLTKSHEAAMWEIEKKSKNFLFISIAINSFVTHDKLTKNRKINIFKDREREMEDGKDVS